VPGKGKKKEMRIRRKGEFFSIVYGELLKPLQGIEDIRSKSFSCGYKYKKTKRICNGPDTCRPMMPEYRRFHFTS
jgi:hypothetical protein